MVFLNVLLLYFLIYGYICAVIASEVPAYQLQKISRQSQLEVQKKNLSLLSCTIYFCSNGSSIFVCFCAIVNIPLFLSFVCFC